MIKFQQVDINNLNGFVIIDEQVATLYNCVATNCLAVKGGEELKTLANVEKIINWLLEKGANKVDTVYAVGGGTVGDCVGLACSLYKRGINLVHVPTTLLAMIDSSIGGKTAVNVGQVKNAMGTIYPSDTIIDTRFLSTLPTNQIENGMGEVYKYKLLSREVDEVNLSDTTTLISRCTAFKQTIVDADMFDNGIRNCLNMGHTVAHALELLDNLSHGNAVASGLYYELLIAKSLGLVGSEVVENYKNYAKFELFDITKNVVSLMLSDKKNSSNKITFCLPSGSYNYSKVELAAEQVLAVIGELC